MTTAKPNGDSELLSRLQSMGDYDFEEFLADLWERQGWDTTVRQRSGDRGVDVDAIIHNPTETKAAIQAKRYASGTKVTPDDIRKYYAVRDHEEADTSIIVTTNEFTSGAEDIAADLNVKIVDGQKLVQLMREHDALDLIYEYTGRKALKAERTVASKSGDSAARELGRLLGRTTARATIGSVGTTGRPHHALVRGWGPGSGWGEKHIRWTAVICVSLLVQAALFYDLIVPTTIPVSTSAISGIGTVFFWFAIPGMIFFDSLGVRNAPNGRNPNWFLWPFGAWIFPIFVPCIYLYLRLTGD